MARSARLTESALSELTQPLLDGEEIDDGTFVEPPKKTTFLQVGAAMYAFLVLGLYAGTIGAIIPYLQSYYELNDLQVSFTFLSGPLGYVLAAQFNHLVHLNLGQRGNAAIGPAFQLLSASITSTHPPFIGVLMSVAFGGIGLGLIDGTWSAWGGIVERANLVSGLLHGAFSVGAMLAPLCITLLLSDGGRPWYSWFHVMSMAALASGLILPWAFRAETAQKYRDEQRRLKVHAISTASVSIFKYSATWFSAAYLLLYAGTESSISGWIISFMLRIRQASPHISSLCSAGFWAGMTGGRLILGGITDRVGVTRGVLYFMICAIGLQLVFFAVQDEVVSLMLIIMIGFFFGPLFPSCIVQLTQLLPQALSVQAVSFVASVGQLGGACLPFGVGALSQLLGLQVFGMVIVVQLTICVFLWILLGRSQMKKSLERVDDEGGIGRHMD